MAVTDARVKFLRGLQADLPSNKTDGNVYIAYDEHAMYIDYVPTGSSTGTVERIRIGDIIELATVAELEALGQSQAPKSTAALYYVTDGNILAKWNATTREWVQINGQSITNVIKAMAYNVTTASNATSTIKLLVTKPDNTRAFEDKLQFKLSSASTAALQLSSASDSNGIYTVTLRVKDLTDISELATTTTTYGDNEVPLNLYNYSTGTDAAGNAVAKPASMTPTTTLKLVGDGILHVKSNANGTITLSTALSMTSVFDAQGNFKIDVKDTNLNTSAFSATSKPIIQIGQSGATSNITFNNGTAVLPVYTITQTDDAIATAIKNTDAMRFRGTVGSALDGASVTALPLAASTVSIGDTYKVITNDTYTINNLTTGNQAQASVGDMFIATSVNGQEDADGYILPANIRWVYIPSGDDLQTVKWTYSDGTTKDLYLAVNNVNNGVKLRIDQTDLVSTSAGTGVNQVVTLAHKTYAAITPSEDANTSKGIGVTGAQYGEESFTAITGLTVSNGHITDIKTGTFRVGSLKFKSMSNLSALYNGSTAVTASASAKATGARLQTTLTYQDNTRLEKYFALKSDSLTFTLANTTEGTPLGIDLMWETF